MPTRARDKLTTLDVLFVLGVRYWRSVIFNLPYMSDSKISRMSFISVNGRYAVEVWQSTSTRQYYIPLTCSALIGLLVQRKQAVKPSCETSPWQQIEMSLKSPLRDLIGCFASVSCCGWRCSILNCNIPQVEISFEVCISTKFSLSYVGVRFCIFAFGIRTNKLRT